MLAVQFLFIHSYIHFIYLTSVFFSDLSIFLNYQFFINADAICLGNTKEHVQNVQIEKKRNQDVLKGAQKFSTSAEWGPILVWARTELIFIIVACMVLCLDL